MTNSNKAEIAKRNQETEKDIQFIMKGFRDENYNTEKLKTVLVNAQEFEKRGGSNANRRMIEAVKRLLNAPEIFNFKNNIVENSKLFIVLAFIIASITGNAQNDKFSYAATSINSQLISPNISLSDEQTSVVVGEKLASVYVSKPITTNYDTFTLGGGYNYSDIRHYSNPELYVGRMGNEGDGLRMSLIFGMYRVNSDGKQLNGQGKLYLDRRASYAGASLSYHVNEATYFGLTVRDVYDVAYTNGDDNTFFLYEAMTPTLFGSVKAWDNVFESVNIAGQYSYNSVEKSKYNVAANYESDRLTLGAFFDGSAGALAKYKTEWMDVQASYDGNFYIGIIIKDIP